MLARTVTVGAVISALICAVSATPARGAPTAASACRPGIRPIGSQSARIFCGPARARVRLGGKTLTFENGQCSRLSTSLAVNIGTLIIGDTKSKTQYFGLLLAGHAKDGTYIGALLSFRFAGKGYAVGGTRVTISGNRTRGTFKGKAVATGMPVSGSFTC